MISAAVVKELIAAGVTGDALVMALERIEASAMPVRSKGAERQARYRERQNERNKSSHNVTSDDKKEIPHTPLEKTTTIENNSAGARPSKGSRLPGNFEPTPDLLQSVAGLGFSQAELLDQLERFRDWANAATGQVAIKRDWQAAFRNWLKRAADNRKAKPNGSDRQGPNTLAAGFAAVESAVDEILRREAQERDRGYEDYPQTLPRLRQVSG